MTTKIKETPEEKRSNNYCTTAFWLTFLLKGISGTAEAERKEAAGITAALPRRF
jgi:hypothetical protein